MNATHDALPLPARDRSHKPQPPRSADVRHHRAAARLARHMAEPHPEVCSESQSSPVWPVVPQLGRIPSAPQTSLFTSSPLVPLHLFTSSPLHLSSLFTSSPLVPLHLVRVACIDFIASRSVVEQFSRLPQIDRVGGTGAWSAKKHRCGAAGRGYSMG